MGVDYALGVTSLAGSRRFAPRPSLPEAAPAAVLGVLLALAASAAVAGGLGAAGPSLWPSVAAGVALLAVLALAIWRYDAAVALGLLLMGVVRIEPAPVDGVMAIVMAVALVTGRFDLRSAPLWASGLVGVFLAFNLLACVEAIKPGRAALFLTTTVYVCLLGLWTSGYVRTVPRARLVFVTWLAVAIFSAVVGTLALYVAFPGSTLLTNSFGDRARALFKDPNVYGPFLVPVAVLRPARGAGAAAAANRPHAEAGDGGHPGARGHGLLLACRVAEPGRGVRRHAGGAAAAAGRDAARGCPAAHARGRARRGRGDRGAHRLVVVLRGAREHPEL